MISKIFTTTNQGLQTFLIEVEVDLIPSLPNIVIVGLPDKAVQESKERIRSAITQSGYEFPLGKITVNLAPADLNKNGTGFDLPIALGVLQNTGLINKPIDEKFLFLGELALDGSVRKINNILSVCLWAQQHNYKAIFVPKGNQPEASLVKGIDIFAVEKLSDVVNHINQFKLLEPIKSADYTQLVNKIYNNEGLLHNDMAYVKGQKVAKRALEIAAAGGHNILLIGSPGSGKTLLARSYPTILPVMSEGEMLETTQIYSAAGLLHSNSIILERPFRSPHHSASHVSLVGGGIKMRPGEISLAHRGVLFLDEFPEFSRETIEALRQPLEDGFVTITRANGSVSYPSKFYLLAAANPTPSGYNIDEKNALTKIQNQKAVERYQSKFSGPILDRIDLQVEVDKVSKDELQSDKLEESSREIAQRVQQSRNIQTTRFAGEKIHSNSEMNLPLIKKYCQLDEKTEKILSMAVDKFDLSARAYMRILKLARTIADLKGNEKIQDADVLEALQYRGKWIKS